MFIQYLYTDDTYKSTLKSFLCTEVIFREETIENCYTFMFSINSDSFRAAKSLSNIHNEVISNLEENKLFVLYNGAAQYFNERLYPLVNKFECNFRRVLSLIAVKNNNETAQTFARQVVQLEFGAIYDNFFTDKTFLKNLKAKINGQNLSKNDLLKEVNSMEETTLWDTLLKKQYPYIPNQFSEIKSIRNGVMHAHYITSEEYRKGCELLNDANNELEKIIADLFDNQITLYDNIAKFNVFSKFNIEEALQDTAYNKVIEVVSNMLKSLEN